MHLLSPSLSTFCTGSTRGAGSVVLVRCGSRKLQFSQLRSTAESEAPGACVADQTPPVAVGPATVASACGCSTFPATSEGRGPFLYSGQRRRWSPTYVGSKSRWENLNNFLSDQETWQDLHVPLTPFSERAAAPPDIATITASGNVVATSAGSTGGKAASSLFAAARARSAASKRGDAPPCRFSAALTASRAAAAIAAVAGLAARATAVRAAKASPDAAAMSVAASEAAGTAASDCSIRARTAGRRGLRFLCGRGMDSLHRAPGFPSPDICETPGAALHTWAEGGTLRPTAEPVDLALTAAQQQVLFDLVQHLQADTVEGRDDGSTEPSRQWRCAGGPAATAAALEPPAAGGARPAAAAASAAAQAGATAAQAATRAAGANPPTARGPIADLPRILGPHILAALYKYVGMCQDRAALTQLLLEQHRQQRKVARPEQQALKRWNTSAAEGAGTPAAAAHAADFDTGCMLRRATDSGAGVKTDEDTADEEDVLLRDDPEWLQLTEDCSAAEYELLRLLLASRSSIQRRLKLAAAARAAAAAVGARKSSAGGHVVKEAEPLGAARVAPAETRLATLHAVAQRQHRHPDARHTAAQRESDFAEEDEDAVDNCNDGSSAAILTVQAGVGGEDAALFSKDLFCMYTTFAASQGWKFTLLDAQQSERGGYRRACAQIEGRGVVQLLLLEAGVHRVQRVPPTETRGRMQTSAVAISVVPVESTEDAREAAPAVDMSPAALRIEFMRASGPGGQSVNKSETAVRVLHKPSGLSVVCMQTQSQKENQKLALESLRTQLQQRALLQRQQQRSAAQDAQVGGKDRSEKIRTYNFQRDVVTDHRCRRQINGVKAFLDDASGLSSLLEELQRQKEQEYLCDLLKQLRLALSTANR